MGDAVQHIKERLSILDVVAPYVKLSKAGKSWRGLSPFNKEKTPSFFVSPDRGFYHCFSSGKGGDMFTFIQEMEGVDFRGALKILAEKAGVELVPEKPAVRDARERGLAALARAAELFERELERNAEAMRYLRERGLSDSSIRAWKLGYARDEWRALSDALKREGFSEEELLSAGLVKHPESEDAKDGKSRTPYDRFRGRIMFPIRDTSGRVIAFSGRTFGAAQKDAAKYLNSPETSFFDKSRVLHGFDRAKESMRKLNFAILVEGQMDLLMAHQIGYANTVATSGTALTGAHLALIARITKNVVVAYDGDRAGVAAGLRAASLALQSGMNVKLAALPEGKDPADLIKEDAGLWRAAVKEAAHPVEYLLARLRAAHQDERTFRLAASEEVLPLIARVSNSIDRAHFAKLLAERIGTPEDAVLEELARVSRSLQDPSRETVRESIVHDVVPRADAIRERLLAAREYVKDDAPRHADITERLAVLLGESAAGETLSSSRLSELLFEFERVGTLDEVMREVDELFAALRELLARETYEQVMRSLKDAEARGETERAKELLRHLNDLRRELPG